jgi:SPP1 gp7 family putative phage head morphogenesis protein
MPSVMQRVLRMERDRSKLEATGRAAAERIGLQARLAAIRTWEQTYNPVLTARAAAQAIVGPDGLTPVVSRGMLAGHLAGVRRSDLNLREQGVTSRRLRLSTAYDAAIALLLERTQLTREEAVALLARYGQVALGAVGGVTESLAERIAQTLADAIAKGASVKQGVTLLRDAFTAEGVVPGANYTLQAVFRTQTQLAYSAGRLSALAEPAVQEILWGFKYVTVGDDRVRPAHAAMDGVTRPKDDPIWNVWQPPCGYNCRCATLEIFDSGTATKVPPNVQPDQGFAFNPLDLVRDVAGLRRAA